jgi:hypothetical protein
MSLRRLRATIFAALLLAPAPALADVHFVPFGGRLFGAHTTLIDPLLATERPKWVFGGTVTVIGEGLFGLEGDFQYVGGFWESPDTERPLVTGSKVITLMGNVVIAIPRRITRESLRPYFSGGAGTMIAQIDTLGDALNVDAKMFGINLGGGATGFITPFTGVRWDVRYFRAVGGQGQDPGISIGTARLSFWRFTMGLVLKY